MERYSLQKVIGEGSFGRALLVRCKSSQEKYVVKEIQLPKNNSKLENPRREAILLSKMKHPNIVTFREAFEADGLLCIVMEFCSGGDLLQRMQQQKTTQFSVDHILRCSKAYANAYVGTPYYVAPEIWDNKPYNNKSDVWSLGCVLYELCTLRHPFQASSWKSLILKVCRGAYPPLPNHLPYELQYLLKQMFKTNPKDRPSMHSILTSHRVSKLLRAHLPSQGFESFTGARDAGTGEADGSMEEEEGKKVANLLGEKSLITTSTFEGVELHEAHSESREPGPRKQWAAGPSDTVLQMLANASLVSSDSMGSTCQSLTEEPGDSRQRRRWDKDPPETLLSVLEKARLSRAFSTFLINPGGEDPLVGPLSQPQGDHPDGPEPEVALDEERLQPRSDDEDTDFEEEYPCDWMDDVTNDNIPSRMRPSDGGLLFGLSGKQEVLDSEQLGLQGTEARKRKIEAVTAGYAHSSRILVRGLTAQQKVTTASLKASWVLAKHNRPFTDAEVFKEVMVTVLEELATDKSMDGVIASAKQVSLSARSAIRRIEALSDAVQGGQVTELMLDFIKQLRANFTSRFEDYSIPKDIIAFVRDPLTVRPSGDFTSQAKQMIPSLDEAALEMELIDFQTSSLVSDALRSAESVSAFGVGSSEEYSTIKRLTLDPLPPTDLVLVGQALPLSCDPELWSESEDEDLTPISPPTQLTFLEREHTLRSPLMPPQKLLLTRVLITPEDL
ncbi:Serine/threonine-protein kinase Nek3, partial [Dissostichus eleginoides]